jgi:hypothetical protein
MSCYFRHLQDIFNEAGIKITPTNKKEVDQAIHRIVKVTYKNCPETWKEIKLEIADVKKRKEFIQKLKKAVPGRS